MIMIDLSPHLKQYYQQLVDANNAAYTYTNQGMFLEAIPYIENALKYMNLQKPSFLTDRKDKLEVLRLFRKIYGFAGYIYGNAGNDELSLLCYQKAWYLRFQVKTYFDEKSVVKLYQFRSYNKEKTYAIDNLQNYQISLTDPREQNDIVDSPVFAWMDHCLDENQKYNGHLPMLRKSLGGIKTTSFCTDTTRRKAVKNTLMWAHYADSHKGFCVEYEIDNSMFKINDPSKLRVARMLKVDYRSAANKPLDFSDKKQTLSMQEGFFCKSRDWFYEHEVRMALYSPKEEEDYPTIPLCGNSRISAIYFGVNCPKETIEKVKDALGCRNVKYYQMGIDVKNIHTLTYEEMMKL